jgi:hypothetical protein
MDKNPVFADIFYGRHTDIRTFSALPACCPWPGSFPTNRRSSLPGRAARRPRPGRKSLCPAVRTVHLRDGAAQGAGGGPQGGQLTLEDADFIEALKGGLVGLVAEGKPFFTNIFFLFHDRKLYGVV